MAEETSKVEKQEEEKPLAKGKAKESPSLKIIEDVYTGTVEKSFQESTYYPDSQQKPYNPDPLVRKDYTYGVYEEMLMDDQVDVALKLKKDLVIGSGWYIESEDEDVTTELSEILEDQTERPFTDILEDIIQAYEYGFSLSEKIFKNLDDGRLALKDIKPRHPSTWLIHTDEYGNVTRYQQRGPQKVADTDINPMSLIHYVNNQKFQNPYGRSDLYTAYQAWMSKKHVTRFYAIYLENAAGAKPVAKYDRKAPQSVVDEIFQIVKKFQTKTAMVIPKEFEVEFLEAKTNGEAYVKGINLFNMFIGRSLFVPDLIGFSGSETSGGSLALGKDQIGVFYKHIYRRRSTLEYLIDKHIIRPLCVYNYGLMEKYPKFKFKPLSEDDAIRQAELWIKGVQGAGWNPTPEEVNHFRRLVKFPQSDEVEMKAEVMAEMMGDAVPKEENSPDGKEKDPKEEKKEQPKDKKKAFAKLSSHKGEYHKKTNFKLADQILKTNVSKIMTEAGPVVEDIFEDLYDQLQKKKIVERQDLDKLDGIQLKYLNRLQQVYKKHFRRLYDDAYGMATAEVKAKKEFATNIPSDEFLDFINKETFKYVGDWAYSITKKTKDELIKAIKDGKPLSSVISVMDDEGKELSDISLERYSRTKTTEVFNRARMEHFEKSGIVAAYQFSAILDDVTSDICGNLHGLTFEKGTEPVPPLHFNCRSVLIPITKYEDWSQDTVTNSGEDVDKFLTEQVEEKGFPIS